MEETEKEVLGLWGFREFQGVLRWLSGVLGGFRGFYGASGGREDEDEEEQEEAEEEE